MTFIKSTTAALSLGVCALISQSAMGQQFGQSDFVVVSTHIDNVRGPISITDLGKQCSDDMACSALATLISNASGVPVDRIIAVVGALATQHDGEGTFMTIGLPSG
ncbi:MAG: hypothetical protein ABIT69_01525 [Sphingomicrobium sp.]